MNMLPSALFALLLAVPQSSTKDPDGIDEIVSAMIGRVDADDLRKTVDDLVAFGTRHVLSTSEAPDRGRGAAQKYLEARLRAFIEASGGRLSVERQVGKVTARRLGREIEVVNIVATLKGVSDPDRIYVVGGHYDSRNSSGRDGEGLAPGANDDGSGTAAVIEACRVMCGQEFAATIKFVCFDGEEQGLLGSRQHAEALAAKKLKVDGMITNDIVGNTLGMDAVTRDSYLRCFSYSPSGNDSVGRSLARAASWAAHRVPDIEVKLIYRGDRYGRGGDHRSFFDAGFPSVRFTEPREDFSRQHQNITQRNGHAYGDLPDYMDFAYLAKVTRVNVSLLAGLASSPPSPSAVRVRGARDANDTLVSWQPVESASAYEIVWRETTSGDWESSRLLEMGEIEKGRSRRGGAPELRFSLRDVCVDDVVIGVRCVAENGSRSRTQAAPDGDSASRGRTSRGGQRRGR